ncbi:MAG: Ldh family oxidoreductase [Verrucomicrobiales bacterium]|nr:Ldh family oxidoreductase [Verrucomicrobiales bacterium]
MPEKFFVVPEAEHESLVAAAYKKRGFNQDEADDAARFCSFASAHAVRTHNAIKALHLDDLFGSGAGGCVPGAEIEIIENRFAASEVWNCNRKLGQSVAYAAIERCIELADQYGIGQVSVDNAFHYLWGGGYVLDAAKRGYIAYTSCTAGLAEVVPFMGKYPTLGTNPHSWGFPTDQALGFPVVIDWATSVVAMGRVQQIKREGGELPPNAAVDKDGKFTTDPEKAAYLVPFGAHKGYGMALINEIIAAFIGGSLPTLRSREIPEGEKRTPSFYFQVIHPDALSGGDFARGRSQAENIKAVIEDIRGHGNETIFLPGQDFAQAASRTERAGGLLFSEAEIAEFNQLAAEADHPGWDSATLPAFDG